MEIKLYIKYKYVIMGHSTWWVRSLYTMGWVIIHDGKDMDKNN